MGVAGLKRMVQDTWSRSRQRAHVRAVCSEPQGGEVPASEAPLGAFLAFLEAHPGEQMLLDTGILHTAGCTARGGHPVDTTDGVLATSFGACCSKSFDLSDLIDALKELTDGRE